MFLVGFPLLLIPFAIYNIIAFLFGTGFNDTLFTVRMLSGAEWGVTTSDILLLLGILLLFVEILKATRFGTRAIVDHILSLLLFIAMLAEFMIVHKAATSTFFILLALSFVDVVSGFSVTIRTAQRDIALDTDHLPQ
ncbi:MAG: hypothetical protein HY659_14845 [Rhizobiales bacterium]|nr:hypothetical protein [Hyphomicrobiales bacterium]